MVLVVVKQNGKNYDVFSDKHLGIRGVGSLKFLTPTPLLLWLNILRLRNILKF